jgi:hypothetical protein
MAGASGRCGEGGRHGRPGCHGRRARHPSVTATHVERLEPRRCLAVAPFPLAIGAAGHSEVADTPTPAAVRIVWQGDLVAVRPGAWIVGADPGLPSATFAVPAPWSSAPLGEGLHSLAAPGASSADVLGWAAATPGIEFVEPDFVVAPARLPDDPAFGRLWGLAPGGTAPGLTGAGIDAVGAWPVTTGSRDVVVAVIDTGIDMRHPDLMANIWRNPGEIPGDGIDNDANGFVDDVHGWNFVHQTNGPHDDNGHGTHVAGTIGAVGDNRIGGTGVAWQVSLMPLKFLDRSGSGATSAAVAAITYATRMRRDFGISIVATNNSWGGAGASASLRRAIEAGGRAGILFVAAAGNDGTDNDSFPSYPASAADDSVIAVAATDRQDRLATFSNIGATSVDVAAPGVAIRSTVPGGRSASFSGTSMAAPHVTGVVALLAAARPTATAAQIREAILTTVRPVAGLAGRVATGGVVDAAAAVRAILAGAPPAVSPDDEPPPAPGDVAPVVPPPAPPVEFGDLRGSAHPVRPRTGIVTFRGLIGDGRFGDRDVDLFRVRLAAGQRVVIDVAAQSLPGGSALDSVVRVFSRTGRRLASNDDRADSLDSLLVFRAARPGVYYVGVSGFGNAAYGIQRVARRDSGSMGIYEVTLRFAGHPAPRGMPQVLGFPDVLVAFAAYGGAGAEPVKRRA